MTTKCLVVLSGGQDSTTCAFWATQHFDEVHCITFDYNQRHRREIDAARNIAKLIKAASHEVIELGPILKGRSPLISSEHELETYQNFEQMDKEIGDRVELTFVPMRNALFLTIAANRAVCKDIYTLVTGVCQADNANYPDCRQTFIDHQEATVNHALGLDKENAAHDFNILTPLMNLSKAESVQMAYSMPNWAYAALAFTHTAYDGQYPPVGSDHATILRAHGFEESGLPDPLVLKAWNEGDMNMPQTPNYHDLSLNANIMSEIDMLAKELL